MVRATRAVWAKRVQRWQRSGETAREFARVKAGGHPDELSQIIDAHLVLLQDESLERAAVRVIRDERINAEWAVRRVAEEIRAALAESGDDYFRERSDDVVAVTERVVRNLVGLYVEPTADVPEGAVVVAHDLSPVDMGSLANRGVAAVATEAGSRTSHTAILARALGLPAVVGAGDLLEHGVPSASVRNGHSGTGRGGVAGG